MPHLSKFPALGKLARPEGEAQGMVMVFWAEQPTGLRVYQLVIGEGENGQDLVAVRVVGFFAGVVAVNAVFVVVIETVARAFRAVFGEAIRIFPAAFFENNELGFICGLAGLAQVSPEPGFFHVVTSAVVEISGRFTGNGCLAFFLSRSAHVRRSGAAGACALAEENACDCDGGQFEV